MNRRLAESYVYTPKLNHRKSGRDVFVSLLDSTIRADIQRVQVTRTKSQQGVYTGLDSLSRLSFFRPAAPVLSLKIYR